MNEFHAWLAAKGFGDASALSAEQTQFLQATWRAELNRPAPAPVPAPAPAAKADDPTPFDQKLAAIQAETDRIEYIRAATLASMERNVGDAPKCKLLADLCQSAINDPKTDKRAYDLALLRADRSVGPLVYSTGKPALTESVIEAAVCVTQRLPGVEKKFSDQELQSAHTRFRRGIGLQEMLLLAAETNGGYRGSPRDVASLCRAAFRPAADAGGFGLMAGGGSGPSTISVPGILSNVGNKFLEAGFLYTEQAWRGISRIRPASDYKQMTTYRLTGSMKFEKVAPGGEIKHGTLGELEYTNQASIYGKMIGLDERDIRNDDMGAFTGAADHLGRGAGDSLNEVFWTEWLDDATFFPTDGSKGNYDNGATDSVLSLAGLVNADTIFGLQTKPDGTPLGAMPTILLVPRALRATALNLMNGTITNGAASTATETITNVWAGMFKVVDSVYLQSTALTGYSATAWYLLADPNNIPCIEVVFLDGIDRPTIETAEFDFNRLGIAMRGTMRWGCNKQEYRGGVKLKGAA